MKNNKTWFKKTKNDEKQSEIDTKQWKKIKNNEEHWQQGKAMKNKEKQWKIMKTKKTMKNN